MAAFEAFRRKYGQPEACVEAPAPIVNRYRGELPDALLNEWTTVGWCRYGQGLFWIVNPTEYDDALSEWVDDTGTMCVVARTAFGSLITWDGNQAFLVHVLTGDLLPMLDSIEELFDDMLTDDAFLGNEFRAHDFEWALEHLGVLGRDECYGYFPPLALGGSGAPETLKKVKLREHLHFLAQLFH